MDLSESFCFFIVVMVLFNCFAYMDFLCEQTIAILNAQRDSMDVRI